MLQKLYELKPEERFAAFLAAATFLSVLIISLAFIWASVRKAAIAADLKREMLDRGMSAQDIRVVIEAGSPKWCASSQPQDIGGIECAALVATGVLS